MLNSPLFQCASYSSSATPTQFTDAAQRAENASHERPDWHTILTPAVKPKLTMTLNAGTYDFALNPDGTCCAFILVNAVD